MVLTRRQVGTSQIRTVALPRPSPSSQSAAASSEPSGLSSSA